MGLSELAGVRAVVPSTKLAVPVPRLGGSSSTEALLQGVKGCTLSWPGLTGAGGC